MKVAFLSMPFQQPLPAVAPILLAGICSKAGIEAKGYDFAFDWYDHFSKHKDWVKIKHLLAIATKSEQFHWSNVKAFLKFNKEYIMQFKDYDWIGLSVFTVESYDYAKIMTYSIRRWLPHIKIVVGGKGIETQESSTQLWHSDIWYEHGMCDLLMVGDCEHTIADCLKKGITGIYRSSAQTKKELDDIPLAQWNDYDLKKYLKYRKGVIDDGDKPYMAITSSKGCVRRCSFCDVVSFWPRYIYRDPDKVADEIITNYRATGITDFFFTDNLMNGSVTNFRKINQRLVDEIPGEITYGGYAIFRGKNQMPVKDFELAAQAGSKWWSIGLESGSERLRYDIGKKFTDEDLDWTANLLAKNKIFQQWLLIVGYPSESDEDFQKTLDMLYRYRHLAKTGMVEINVTPTFQLLRNSPIMMNAHIRDKLGLSHNMDNPNIDKFWTSTVYPENTFPVRAERYRIITDVIAECGYGQQNIEMLEKYKADIDHQEQMYYEKYPQFKSKISA